MGRRAGRARDELGRLVLRPRLRRHPGAAWQLAGGGPESGGQHPLVLCGAWAAVVRRAVRRHHGRLVGQDSAAIALSDGLTVPQGDGPGAELRGGCVRDAHRQRRRPCRRERVQLRVRLGAVHCAVRGHDKLHLRGGCGPQQGGGGGEHVAHSVETAFALQPALSGGAGYELCQRRLAHHTGSHCGAPLRTSRQGLLSIFLRARLQPVQEHPHPHWYVSEES